MQEKKVELVSTQWQNGYPTLPYVTVRSFLSTFRSMLTSHLVSSCVTSHANSSRGKNMHMYVGKNAERRSLVRQGRSSLSCPTIAAHVQ